MRASYRYGIEWIAFNEDEDLGRDQGWLISICLLADLFGKSTDEVGRAVERFRTREARRAAR